LLWVDRRGVPDDSEVTHSESSFRYPSLSLDGRRLAVAETDSRTAKLDIWTYDLQRGIRERLTTDPLDAIFPVWTPDGDRVIYASARQGPWNLFWRAEGRPDEGVLYAAPSPASKYPTDVTRDGRYLLFQEADDRPNVWLLSLKENRPAVRLLTGMHARVSPSGRWLAYTSVETGRREVYVTAFPVPQSRWRVSTTGGEDPHWRADGRELFFLDANQTLTAVDVTRGAQFEVRRPQPLFRLRVSNPAVVVGPSYMPAPDGRRFLVNERVEEEAAVLTAIENWSPDGT
jgi:Tol biopolymer transport system component